MTSAESSHSAMGEGSKDRTAWRGKSQRKHVGGKISTARLSKGFLTAVHDRVCSNQQTRAQASARARGCTCAEITSPPKPDLKQSEQRAYLTCMQLFLSI